MIFRRRFADAIGRQLDLFEQEYGELLAECDEAEEEYDNAPREEAEERFGDYMDLVEAGTEALAELRDNFASTLEGEVADEYRDEFNRAVLKRFPRFGLEIEDV